MTVTNVLGAVVLLAATIVPAGLTLSASPGQSLPALRSETIECATPTPLPALRPNTVPSLGSNPAKGDACAESGSKAVYER
jgi:hypothetical protein